MTTIDAKLADEAVSAAEANRQFSAILRGVREGRSYVVTSHGRPVARIVPATTSAESATGARELLVQRLKSQPAVNAGRWSREDLYEDEA
jgi:prevent-host-death family protein